MTAPSSSRFNRPGASAVSSRASTRRFPASPIADERGGLERTAELVVPALTIYEVFERILQQRAESDGLRAVAVMQQGAVVDLDTRLALTAARIGVDTRLPPADCVVLATARLHEATLWTQDADFEAFPDVRSRPRRR